MELMRRAALERREAGRAPVKYVIVLTKTDKAGKKALKMTRDAVYKSVAELITSLPDKNESPSEAESEADTDAGVTGVVDHSPATASIDSNNSKGQGKSVTVVEDNEVTIIETSAFQRLGREALWEVILKGVLAP